MRSTRLFPALRASLLLIVLAACGTPSPEGSTDAGVDAAEDTAPVEDAGSPPVPVRVMNWNVQNLFNDKIDSPRALDEAGSTPTTANYKKKLTSLAQVIQSAKADVLVLQEVENQAALVDLANQPELGGKYRNLSLVEGNDPRGIDIGVLSTFPLSSVISHAPEKFDGKLATNYRYARDCLEVHLDVNGRELILLGVHMRSQISGGGLNEDDKRWAEANHTRALADHLLAAKPGVPLGILGDFNDFPGTPTIDAIQKGTPPFSNAVTRLPSGDAWTVNYGTPRIYDDQWADPALTSMRDDSSITVIHGKTVSDHAPVIVTYTLP